MRKYFSNEIVKTMSAPEQTRLCLTNDTMFALTKIAESYGVSIESVIELYKICG